MRRPSCALGVGTVSKRRRAAALRDAFAKHQAALKNAFFFLNRMAVQRAGRLASKPTQIGSKYETNAQFRRAEPDAPYQPPLAVIGRRALRTPGRSPRLHDGLS